MALDEDWALTVVPDGMAESLGADMYSELTEAREFGSHIRIPRSVLRSGLPALTPEDFSRAVRVLPQVHASVRRHAARTSDAMARTVP
eukprot:COSAG01_NODE_36083_length_522_cov_1.463357_1_plen_87_part_10